MSWARLLAPLATITPPFARGRRNALDICRIDAELTFPDLPAALDGFSILHLSDPHPSALPGVVDRASSLASEMEVDLAVVTGDLQLRGRPSAPETASALAPLLAAVRARHGIFAVLGNHDRHDMAEALEQRGVRVLVNEHAVLDHGDVRVVLTGTDDAHRFYTDDALRALGAAPEGFRIALVHSPDLAVAAAKAGHHLYLTGHTHGGQICLPGGVPVVTASDAPRRLAAGSWRWGDMVGYTSRGIGVGSPPLRYNCRGEVARLVLRRQPRPNLG